MSETHFETTSREMMAFIEQSPTCYHAVRHFQTLLDAAGFQPLREHEPWKLAPGGRYYTVRNGSSIIAFSLPAAPYQGFLIAAAHSDSPCFKIKEKSSLETAGQYVRLNVEPYGGMLMFPWFDRPLSVAGRVTAMTGQGIETRLVNMDRDLVLIPSLAIHMNRSANQNASLNPQKDLLPLYSMAGAVPLRELIAGAAGVRPDAILSHDLFVCCRMPGTVWGANREFIASPRLDDLQCAWAAMTALLQAENSTHIPLCAVFDNEEVGSGTKQGAGSTFLEDVMKRISDVTGHSREEYQIQIARSFMLSADNAHALHPNYPEKADDANRPFLNGGVVLKYSANQKYTTDSVSAALFLAICRKAGVPVQVFANRSDIPGGSTLGNISSSHVSLNTADIGLAQLAMHSPFETAGVKDTLYLVRALTAFFGSRLTCLGDGSYRLE